VGAGEEIVMLARELAGAAERTGDLNKCRAFIESSLEAAPFPRHRAILLGMLVRAAVRGRDFEAAERWLQHFEGGYADLESDSEWRVSTAVVATARRDYTTVLSALGRSFGEIALQDALDAQGVVFRAHALEQLGQLPEATLQISQLLERGGPAMRTGLEQMVKMYGALGLCPGSLGQVLAQRESSARASAGVGKLVLGAILILVPLLPAGIGVIIGASLFLSGEATLDEPGAWVGAVVPIAMSAIFFLSFGLWGIRTVVAGLRERAAFSRGVRATARVLSARPTGVSVNDQPEMLIELEVALMPPVRSSLRRVIHPGEMHALMPGTVLHVRVDPAHPETAVLDH
jgi:hypothetical protein